MDAESKHQDMGQGVLGNTRQRGCREAEVRPAPWAPIASSCPAFVEGEPRAPPCGEHHCVLDIKRGPTAPNVTTPRWDPLCETDFQSIRGREVSWPNLERKFFFQEKAKAVCIFLSKTHCGSSLLCTMSTLVSVLWSTKRIQTQPRFCPAKQPVGPY